MCKETPDGEKCQTTYFWRDVSVVVLSLSVSLPICLFLFCFVGLFLRLSFIQILPLVALSFYHFEGSFHFWVLSWGLVLRPFSACSVLMSFSDPPFHVSCGFFLFWLLLFSVLFSLGRCRASFFCVRLFRFFFPGPFSTQLFPLLVLFSAVCRAWIHWLFSFFSPGLFFGLLVFSDSVLGICRVFFFFFFFFWGGGDILISFSKACS